MTKINRPFIYDLVFYTSFLILISAFEVSFWSHLFGGKLTPHFWIPFFIFWILKKPLPQAFSFILISLLFLLTLTALNPLLFLLSHGIILIGIFFLLKKFHFPEAPIFPALCWLHAFLLPFIIWILSQFFEEHSLSSFQWLRTFTDSLFIGLASPFFLPFFYWLEKLKGAKEELKMGERV